jgi:hypothetical protein
LAWRDILGHACLTADHDTISDMDMTHDADLTRENHIVPGAAGPGDADLANYQVVASDFAIVADLDQVIDFCPGADLCRLKRASVNRRSSADFDIVLDFNVA